MSVIRTARNEQGELLYCLDDLRELLTFEDIFNVSNYLIKTEQKIYKKAATKNTRPCTFVTQAGLNKVLSCIGSREAKALKYLINHGVSVIPVGGGRGLFCARDIAICFGYSNPDKAIRKYCKAAATGYVPESDIYRLADHSKLKNAGRLKAWMAARARY